MSKKKQRRLSESKQNRTSKFSRIEKLNSFLKITIAVLVAGGMFGAGYVSGARPAAQESVSSSETVPESATSSVTDTSSLLTNNSYLPEIPRISVMEVKENLDAGSNIIIIDSRSATDYETEHITGAISIPEREMSGPYDDLEGYDLIITYCD